MSEDPNIQAYEAKKGGLERKGRLGSIPDGRHPQEATALESLVVVVGSENGQSHHKARVVLCKCGRRTREHFPLRFSHPP